MTRDRVKFLFQAVSMQTEVTKTSLQSC